MDKERKQYDLILKQPSIKIADMLRKKGINSISAEDVKFMLKDIGNFFKLLNSDLHIFIVIDYKRDGILEKSILSSKTIDEIMKISCKDNYIMFLDKNCYMIENKLLKEVITEIINIRKYRLPYESIFELSQLFNSTFIYGYGGKYDIYHEGMLIQPSCCVDLSFIHNKVLSRIKPISNYEELINDHFAQCVKHSQATDHWDNKDKRILRSSPEDIFKNSLWYYLYMFSEDTNNVIAEYPLRSGNRIDIYVQSRNNEVYFFEIKVLGKYYTENDNGYSEYKDNRVHHGLNQAIVYINEFKDNSQDIEKAELIIYDAREKQEPIIIPQNEKHEKLSEPQYLYLESKNATNKARIMTSIKKSS